MQITTDNGFASGMNAAINGYSVGANIALQKKLNAAQMAEAAARTQALQTQDTAARAQLDQANRERDLGNAISAKFQSGQDLDPSTPTGLTPASQNLIASGSTGYGSGPSAVNQVMGDNYRENARMGLAQQAGPSAPVVPYGQTAQARDVASLAAMRGNPQEMATANAAYTQAQAAQQVADTLTQFHEDPSKLDGYMAQLQKTHPELNISFSRDKNGTPLLTMPDPKKPGASTTTPLSESSVMNLVAGEIYMQHGLTDTGLAHLSAADQGVAAHAKAQIDAYDKVASSGQNATRIDNEHQYQMGMLGLESQRVGIEGQRAMLDAYRGAPVMQDANGHTAVMMPTRGANGQWALTPTQMPSGYVPVKQEDTTSLMNFAMMHQNDPGPDGKPIGVQAAYAMGRQMVASGGQPQGVLPMVAPPPGGPAAMRGARAQPQQGGRVPEPPPKFNAQQGSSGVPLAMQGPSPEYQAWQQQYGDAYARQQAADQAWIAQNFGQAATRPASH